MWSHLSWTYKESPVRVQRNLFLLDQRFQVRLILFLIAVCLFTFIFSVGPMYYYTRENYEIFSQFSYQVAPELMTHLEREITWVQVFIVNALVASLLFSVFLG